jgi:acyl-CoA thioesterase FadM
MTAKVLKPVSAGDQIVITGWCIEMEGKKHFAGTALFNQKGECCAYSKQVWIGRLD